MFFWMFADTILSSLSRLFLVRANYSAHNLHKKLLKICEPARAVARKYANDVKDIKTLFCKLENNSALLVSRPQSALRTVTACKWKLIIVLEEKGTCRVLETNYRDSHFWCFFSRWNFARLLCVSSHDSFCAVSLLTALINWSVLTIIITRSSI